MTNPNEKLGTQEKLAEATAAAKKMASEVAPEMAAEIGEFIKRNPWAAVAGAAIIGYILGSMRTRSK